MADTTRPLTRESVSQAASLIAPYVHVTPILTNTTISNFASTPRTPSELEGTQWAGQEPAKPKIRLYFKCENYQRIGAFKARGAFHSLLRLMETEGWEASGGRERGVVTHSSGNHAQALSLAARTMSIPAHIVMPTISTPSKIAATKGYGANVIFSGSTSQEREAVVADVIAKTGATLIPPYDHPDIMIGQGTAALQFLEQVMELQGKYQVERKQEENSKGLHAVIAPCGGGGLLSGTALACQGTGTKVFGAEPEFQGGDDCRRGLAAGERITSVKTLTIADGLRTPVGAFPWKVISNPELVKGVYAVTEEEIKSALRLVLERMKVVVEPSAVVPLAVALFNEDFRKRVENEAAEEGWDIGVIFSGGNVSLEALGKLFPQSA